MNRKDAAAALDKSEYGEEGSRELFGQMKSAGLVAVFGASDDIMVLHGAIEDEIGAYGGGKAFLTKKGLLENECDSDDCPHFRRAKKEAAVIEAVWSKDGYSWVYETSIPHETFTVYEDGDTYCRGIVFALADVD